MKVYVLPADIYGCGFYRLIWPAQMLAHHGHDVVVMPPSKESGFDVTIHTSPDGVETLRSLRVPADADLIVLQRPAHRLQPEMIRMLRQAGIAVVVDMDDDMSSIHRDNIAYATYHPRSNTPFSRDQVAQSCQEATLVTTSTQRLQRVYAKHGRGRVLDNYVPAIYLTFPKPETGRFGWPGTTLSHPDDLQVTGRAVRRLVDEGYQFQVIGGPSKVQQALRLAEVPSNTGPVPMHEWARTIANSIDVGMAPLSSSAFNQAKSRLKLLELMAVGVPWVASPREEYRKVAQAAGCGLLADTPNQWYTMLRQLLDDPILRKEQAEAGRAYMQTQTYETNWWRWAEAWEDAIKIQRGEA